MIDTKNLDFHNFNPMKRDADRNMTKHTAQFLDSTLPAYAHSTHSQLANTLGSPSLTHSHCFPDTRIFDSCLWVCNRRLCLASRGQLQVGDGPSLTRRSTPWQNALQKFTRKTHTVSRRNKLSCIIHVDKFCRKTVTEFPKHDVAELTYDRRKSPRLALRTPGVLRKE